MNKLAPVITLDGPSGSGKGTIAALLAKQLDWNLLDSGAVYRVLACAAKRQGVALDDEERLVDVALKLGVHFQNHRVWLEGDDVTAEVRLETTGMAASTLAVLPKVRAALLQRQRDFQQSPGLVADGRDMGTVVFPQAHLKIFLNASPEERARRRHLQLKEQGVDVNLTSLLDEIKARDERDSQRAVAPLKPAMDAIQVDTTALSIEQVLKLIMDEVRHRRLI